MLTALLTRPVPLPGDCSGRVVGPYRFIKPLHRGGMGTIYAGIHRPLRRSLAIKVPLVDGQERDPFLERRLVAEARSLGRVSHCNVVAVHDLGHLPEGTPFLVMELLEGRPLSRVLDEQGALAIPTALRLIQEVASGLAALHEEGIIHGDVKPDNVIIVDGPLVGRSASAATWLKLVDLGTAQPRRTPEHVVRDPTAPVMGTSWYMSPEAILGFALDERSDVYSLSVMLHELLAGTVPFPHEEEDAMRSHLWSDAAPISLLRPEISPGSALDMLLGSGLAKAPADRPGSAIDFLDRLASITSV